MSEKQILKSSARSSYSFETIRVWLWGRQHAQCMEPRYSQLGNRLGLQEKLIIGLGDLNPGFLLPTLIKSTIAT